MAGMKMCCQTSGEISCWHACTDAVRRERFLDVNCTMLSKRQYRR